MNKFVRKLSIFGSVGPNSGQPGPARNPIRAARARPESQSGSGPLGPGRAGPGRAGLFRAQLDSLVCSTEVCVPSRWSRPGPKFGTGRDENFENTSGRDGIGTSPFGTGRDSGRTHSGRDGIRDENFRIFHLQVSKSASFVQFIKTNVQNYVHLVRIFTDSFIFVAIFL